MSAAEPPLSADPAAVASAAAAAAAFLEAVQRDRALLAHLDVALQERLLRACGQVARPDAAALRRQSRAARKARREAARAADAAALDATGIRAARREPVFATPRLLHPPAELLAPQGLQRADAAARAAAEVAAPPPPPVRRPRACYVCKAEYTQLHAFYDAMCPPCAAFNWQKRHQTADLTGHVALITGARVKIGYQAAIKLLRAGARVLVTTRFPADAALRFCREADFGEWAGRLQVYGLDLRHTPSVEAFAAHLLATLPRLDHVLHNACQTVRRPAGFYDHLLAAERAPLAALPAGATGLLRDFAALRHGPALPDAAPDAALHAVAETLRRHDAPALSQLPLLPEDRERSEALFPRGRLDQDLQQVDLRAVNSWRLPLHEVSTVELLEVQLVNAIAPFVLNARLKPLLLRAPHRGKHVVNVSAMEGQFYRAFKTDKHPHTNMAKAALNMMTRTAAQDYVKDGIHMNSVDTGWVTDEDPAAIAQRKTREHGFHPPLDIVDGAARIVDPIFHGTNTGVHVWGQFLKDYAPAPW